jgi:hypothetical protein
LGDLCDEIEYIFFQPAGGTTHAANNSLGDIRFGAANNLSSFVAYLFTRSDAMSLFYVDDSDNFHKNHIHTEDDLKVVISCAMEKCVRSFPTPALNSVRYTRCSP